MTEKSISDFKSAKVRSKKLVFPEPGELTKLRVRIFFASKYPRFLAANKSL